jgi:hypothetical protein
MQNQNTESLSRAIHAARAGQPALAKFHCQQAVEMQSGDPLAWLSDSPSSMYQCLQVAQRDDRYSEIAEAGIAFARALCGTETDFEGSQDETASPTDVAAAPLRISDTHENTDTTSSVAVLPESAAAGKDDAAAGQSETIEPAAQTELTLETDQEQQCVEALNELSAEVNGEDAGLATDANSETPLHPDTDLFAVAQAMLGESPDDEQITDYGLVAGVSVTNDPWTTRHTDETDQSTEIEHSVEQAEATTETTQPVEPADAASPA